MLGLLDDALAQGAAGFSSGLMYTPGLRCNEGRVDRTLSSNFKKRLRVHDAYEELLGRPRRSGGRAASDCGGFRLSLQISHLQAAGENNWQLQRPAVAAIEQAAHRGVDVEFDVYPWLAGSTILTQILPQTALEGGVGHLLGRLRDPAERETIRAGIKPEATWDRVVITAVGKDSDSLIGRSIKEIAEERGVEPDSAVLEILEEQEGNANIVEHCQSIRESPGTAHSPARLGRYGRRLYERPLPSSLVRNFPAFARRVCSRT